MAALVDTSSLDLVSFPHDVVAAIYAADHAALKAKMDALAVKVEKDVATATSFWKAKEVDFKVKLDQRMDGMSDEERDQMFAHFGITTWEEFYQKQGAASKEEFQTKSMQAMKDRMREGQYDCDEEAEVGNVNTCKEYYTLRKELTAKVEHDQCEMLADDKKTWEKGQITSENEDGTFDLYLDKDIASGQYHSWVPADEVKRLPKSPEVKAKLDEVRSKAPPHVASAPSTRHISPHTSPPYPLTGSPRLSPGTSGTTSRVPDVGGGHGQVGHGLRRLVLEPYEGELRVAGLRCVEPKKCDALRRWWYGAVGGSPRQQRRLRVSRLGPLCWATRGEAVSPSLFCICDHFVRNIVFFCSLETC